MNDSLLNHREADRLLSLTIDNSVLPQWDAMVALEVFRECQAAGLYGVDEMLPRTDIPPGTPQAREAEKMLEKLYQSMSDAANLKRRETHDNY